MKTLLRELTYDAKVAVKLAAVTGVALFILFFAAYVRASEKGISEAVQEVISAD